MHKLDKVRMMRVASLMTIDAALVHVAVFLSLIVRFEFSFHNLELSGFVQNYLSLALVYTIVVLILFSAFRLYSSLWEYASVDELRNIVLASFMSGIALYLISLASHTALPRSLPIMSTIMMMVLIAAERFSYRALRHYRNTSKEKKRKTMLIGAGRAGSLVLKDLQHSAHSQNQVVCIVDDDSSKHGTYLMGVKVIGGRECIEEAALRYEIDDIILAMPAASPSSKRDIISLCQKTTCRIQTLPGIYQLASGQVSTQQIRNIEVEDLLGREKVNVDETEISEKLRDKVILVTGGGGSIGSELCRQVAKKPIRKLIIFDIYENNAYDIQQELKRTCPGLNMEVYIGSVRDEKRVNEVFEKCRPDFVCHAAAHKHVPLMEDSPAEAIKNNVFGTFNVAKAADRYQAENFLLISTDKAVNPTNIMGASKRICEMIIQTLSKTSKTRYAAVRFGNVLGSNGSVIPLFRKQIASGGPVTVTHKDIIRYFMTISEAVSLVLQASVYAHAGEVFVLDMGDPVRIDDLARNMIRLSGLEPDVDIKIEYTGLRPGEKLYEELLMQDEGLDTTPNNLIFIGHFNDFDHDTLMHSLAELKDACEHHPEMIKELVKKIVPTYYPSGTAK